MIIDTDKLRAAIDAYYTARIERAHKSRLKNDNKANAVFTLIGTTQIKDEETIQHIETLYNQYFS